MNQTFIERLAALAETGQPFVQVTMVEAKGSTPQDTGSKMLVDANGLVHGTVGGGKVEARAIEHAQNMISDTSTTASELVDWNLQRDIGMTCGGLVKLFFEVYNRNDWRIIVFGAGHVSQSLVKCLLTLNCKVICLDQRQDWIDRLPDSNQLTKICEPNLASYVDNILPTDFVISMTMGHSSDKPVLEAIFKSDDQPAFVGVIGSKTKKAVLVRELKESGVGQELAESFVCPVGLKIGTNQPAEIAISIVAQLLEKRDAAVNRV